MTTTETEHADSGSQDGAESITDGESGGRTRSTITFPYGSLKDAEEIAQALHDQYGGVASPDQLAAALNSASRSGTFRVKVATARIFGVVNVSRGKIALTDRGQRLIDPQTQAATRVEAFLGVPLFNEIHEAYKGRNLPPDVGLEQKMAELGVSPKQTSRARQALQRSAERAGFFKTAKGRLVRPPTPGESGGSADDHSKRKEETVNLSPAGMVDVPFPEMWLRLLNEGQSWPAEKTQEFVESVRKLQRLLEDG